MVIRTRVAGVKAACLTPELLRSHALRVCKKEREDLIEDSLNEDGWQHRHPRNGHCGDLLQPRDVVRGGMLSVAGYLICFGH